MAHSWVATLAERLLTRRNSLAATDASCITASQERDTRGMVAGLLPFGVLVAVGWLVWPALTHALEVWSTTEEFSFGFLVPPVALGIVWWRREALRVSLSAGTSFGLPIVACSLLLYLLAQRIGINALAGVAV